MMMMMMMMMTGGLGTEMGISNQPGTVSGGGV